MVATAGYLTKIEYDNAAGSPVDISTYANSISGLDFLTDMLESNAFGSVNKESIPGLKGGASISIAGDWGGTLHTQLAAIYALSTGATQTLKVGLAGGANGAPFVSVETLLTSYSQSSDVAGKVTFSASLQMTGALATGTYS